MSGLVFGTAGTPASALTGGNMTPGLPADTAAGKLLVLATDCNSATLGPPPDTTLNALGYKRVSPNTNAKCAAMYIKIAGASEAAPTFQWDGSTQATSQLYSFSGDIYTDLTTIVVQTSDRGTNATGSVAVQSTPAPSQNWCAVFRGGHCVKTATNNGSSFLDWAVDHGIYTLLSGSGTIQGGNAIASGFWFAQQGATAAATSTDTCSLTHADTSNNSQGYTVFLKTTAGQIAGGATEASSASGNLQALTGAVVEGASAAASLTTAIQAVGAATAGVAAVAALTNWATVTLAAPLYTGPGGILDPNFWQDVQPQAGSTIYYDATNITIYPNGEISSTTNNCSAVAQFYDGTGWSVGIVIITPQMVTYANILAAAVAALSTSIQMAGAAIGVTNVQGNLTTGIALAGNALTVAQGAAALTTNIQLNAAALVQVTATGALTGGQASLQGNAQALSTALAGLTTQIQLAAQVAANSVVSGALSTQIVLSGAANSLTQANAQLLTAIQLADNAAVVTTSAGAALISSTLAGAANAVATATGSLLTGLLIAGPALVQSSATGALSSGITLAGGAQVDTAVAFVPPGITGQFGRASVNILSPTGLPVAVAAFIQGSACIVSIAYFNGVGAPFVPTAVNYRVDDVVSGANLVPYTNLTPQLSNAVTVTGAQNAMVNNTRSFEMHQILFQITDATGNVSYADAQFEVLRTPGLN